MTEAAFIRICLVLPPILSVGAFGLLRDTPLSTLVAGATIFSLLYAPLGLIALVITALSSTRSIRAVFFALPLVFAALFWASCAAVDLADIGTGGESSSWAAAKASLALVVVGYAWVGACRLAWWGLRSAGAVRGDAA